MSANIIHRDLFEVEISYENQPLKIYDNPEAMHDNQGDAPKASEHIGDFSGLVNKVLILPLVLPKSNRTMRMRFRLMPGFNFLSGNAIRIGLRVGSTIRSSELIWKDDHETKQPDSSSGFHWGRLQLAEASQGTTVITLTRGSKAKYAKFVPLSGGDGKPYSIEIECRVLKAHPDGVGGPDDGHTDALQDAAATSEDTTRPTQPRVKDTVRKVMKQGESVKPATAMTAPIFHPSVDDESKVPPTPSTSPETPKHQSTAAIHTGSPDVPSTATPTPKSTEVKSSSSKRNATEAFGPEQANGNKSTKQLHFQLRKAQAGLILATAKLEQVASKVDKDDVEYLQVSYSKAKAFHRVIEVDFEIKAAELGDKKDSEYLELQARKAEALCKVLEVEEALMGKIELQDSQE
jgi:hypothetical protein